LARRKTVAEYPSGFGSQSLAVIISSRVSSQLLNVVATFLPLKAVLIAADQRVPAFIPDPLKSLEPVLLALLFALVAALAAGLSQLVGTRSSHVRRGDPRGGADPNAVSDFLRATATKERASRQADGILVAIFLVIAALASIWFVAILTLMWLGTHVWFRFSLKGKRDHQLEKFETIQATLDFLKDHAVWIAVAAALGTVWLAGSQAGVTAVLIGVIVSRQALILGPQVFRLSGLATEPARAEEDARPSRIAKLERFESAVLQCLSDRSFLEQMVGQQTTPGLQFLDSSQSGGFSATVLASRGEGLVVMRFLDPSRPENLDRELSLLAALGVPGATVLDRSSDLKGFEVIAYSREIREPVALGNVSREQAWGLQLKLELSSITGELVPPRIEEHSNERRVEYLLRALERLSTLPGAHRDPVERFLSVKEKAIQEWNAAPNVLGFPGGIQPSRVFDTQAGVEVLNPSGWRMAPLGTDWPSSRTFDALAKDTFKRSMISPRQLLLAFFCRERSQLEKAVYMRRFSAVGKHSEKVIAAVHGLSSATRAN
jgi:hypothetical protein